MHSAHHPSHSQLCRRFFVFSQKVHLRLGDLNMVNGMYNEAADEFDKCLTHRSALPCRQSRGVADAHVRRAQALFYASTLEGADKARKKVS